MQKTQLEIDEIHSAIMSANPEADVWVVLIGDDNEIKTIPLWECQMTPAELTSFAISEAAAFNELMGAGTVIAQIVDIRDMRETLRLAETDPAAVFGEFPETTTQ